MRWLPIILLFLIVIASPTYAFSFSEIDDTIVGFFKGIIEKIKQTFTGIFDSIKNAITDFIGGIGSGLKDFATAIFNAMKKPFEVLANSFQDSYNWFRDKLGPAAPLGFTAIVAGAVYLMFRLAKIIVPGPIP